MADFIEKYADKASDELEKRIKRVYKQAAKEVKEKLDDFMERHKARNAKMLQMLADDKISEDDYKRWMQGQVFQGDQWRQKLKDVTEVYVHADEKAREIVGKTTKNVFMEAANYAAYEIEKNTSGAIAFNVYDAKTVERLLKDDPKMLPEWKIDEPKDYIWNEKRVRNAVTQGIIQGESIAEVGNRLTTELSTSNAKKMNMFARTAVNGAQNAGRMDRLYEAEKKGIDVRRKWLATLDGRTRDTHRALDGQVQKTKDPFMIDGMSIRFPGDPTAPARLVYNCRCTLVYVYPKYQHLQHNHERRDQLNDRNIENMTYYQWLGLEKRGKKKEQPKLSNIEAIQKAIKNHTGDWSLEELQEQGKRFSDEINARVGTEEINRKKEELIRRRAEKEQELKEIESKGFGFWTPEFQKCRSEINDLWNEQRTLLRSRNQTVSDVLAEIRQCGGITSSNLGDYISESMNTTQKKKTREEIARGMNKYPSSWLEKSKDNSIKLNPHWTSGRAYYSPRTGEIRVDEDLSTSVHELGHRFENVVPGIMKSEKEFYEKRTKGEKLQWMGQGYGRDEKTRRDNFVEPYMGKEYKNADGEYYAFELVSMGFQYAFTEFEELNKDPDMRDWILGLLASVE